MHGTGCLAHKIHKETAAREARITTRVILRGRSYALTQALRQWMVVQDAPTEPDRLLTVPEAATLMGFEPSYVYEMCRRGDLAAVRRKKYVRIRRSAIKQESAEKIKESRQAPVCENPNSTVDEYATRWLDAAALEIKARW